MSEHSTGTYTKGDRVRHVETPADAVQAKWDGYTVSEQPDESADETKGSEDGYDSQLGTSPELPNEGGTPATGTGTSTTTSHPTEG